MTPQQAITAFLKDMIILVKSAFPNYATRIDSLNAMTVDYPLSAAEAEGDLEAAYEPLKRIILLTPRFAGVISMVADKSENPNETFVCAYWTLAHEITHAISHTRISQRPSDGADGKLTFEIGLAGGTATIENGFVIDRNIDREVLNEAITNYYVLVASQQCRPHMVTPLRQLYRETTVDQDILIAEKLTSLAGENALCSAFFEGKLKPLERGLRNKGINPDLFFELVGSRNHMNRAENVIKAMNMIGVTPSISRQTA